MRIVRPSPRIASAYTVHPGRYGDVTPYAQPRGVCRQGVYREAAWVVDTLQGTVARQEIGRRRQRLQELEQRNADRERRLAQAVVLDREKQAAFASVGQARGVRLPDRHALRDRLVPGQAASVATLGRWTQAAGGQAGALRAVLDAWTQPRIHQAVADEVPVCRPVRRVVEPEGLGWVGGRLTERLDGAGWAEELGQLPPWGRSPGAPAAACAREERSGTASGSSRASRRSLTNATTPTCRARAAAASAVPGGLRSAPRWRWGRLRPAWRSGGDRGSR